MKTVFYQDENGNTRQMGEAEYKSAANWIASGIAATYNADITQMTVAKAKYFIAGIFDKGLLENLYSHEYNGRNRKGVMAELEKQRFMGPTPHPSPPGYCRLKTVENALNLPAGRFTEEQQSLLAQILTLPRGSPGSPFQWFPRFPRGF